MFFVIMINTFCPVIVLVCCLQHALKGLIVSLGPKPGSNPAKDTEFQSFNKLMQSEI